MARHRFSPPVPVMMDTPGLRLQVSSVEVAAEELLKWPKRGPKWMTAVEVCASVLNDLTPSDDARKPFEAAAKEAGKLLPPL